MSRILYNLHADAEGLFEDGLLDEGTMRKLDALCLPSVKTYTAEDVRRIRQEARISPAVFAHILGVGPATVHNWEQGIEQPNGASRRLLQVVEDQGIAALIPGMAMAADRRGAAERSA